jgi:hypothetical protein
MSDMKLPGLPPDLLCRRVQLLLLVVWAWLITLTVLQSFPVKLLAP